MPGVTRSAALTVVVVAAVTAWSGCGPLGDAEEAADCKLPEVPVGSIPSPDEVLPSREKCPDFYKGRPGGGTGAPPVPNQPPDVKLPEPAPPPPAPGLEPGEHDIPSQPAPPYAPGY